MLAEQTQTSPATGHKPQLAFFRQSGWLMVATTVMGGLMYAVHMVARRMPKEEYGLFMTLLQIVTLIGIPTAAVIFFFGHTIMHKLGITNPAGLWVTVLIGLAALWRPLVQGVLQGRQNFL